MINNNKYIHSIKYLNNACNIQLVTGGWSHDEKYKIDFPGRSPLLLRISSLEEKTEKLKEYCLLKQLLSLGFSEFPIPYEFGELTEYGKCYMIISWIAGDNVERKINEFTLYQRYELGIKAGIALKKIHSISGAASPQSRKDYLLTKFIDRYETCKRKGLLIKRFDICKDFVFNNLDVFNERKTTFLHGDYQGRNIIITPSNQIGVIDFNRICEGDPFSDFDRLMEFTRFFDISFSIGQIDGYFNGNISDDFFRALYFYSTLAAINSLNISLIIGDTKVIEAMLPALDKIIEETDGFKNLIPLWYPK